MINAPLPHHVYWNACMPCNNKPQLTNATPHGLSLPMKIMEINEKARRGMKKTKKTGRAVAASNNGTTDTNSETIEPGQWRFNLRVL